MVCLRLTSLTSLPNTASGPLAGTPLATCLPLALPTRPCASVSLLLRCAAPCLTRASRTDLVCQGNPERPNVRFSTELKGHNAPIEKVAFNPIKDAELCSVSNDGTVKFWDVRTKNCVNEVKGLGDAFTLAWDPEGESLIVGNKVAYPTQKETRI